MASVSFHSTIEMESSMTVSSSMQNTSGAP
eukprot:bmy_06444T0